LVPLPAKASIRAADTLAPGTTHRTRWLPVSAT
jgi:hypothetical protein